MGVGRGPASVRHLYRVNSALNHAVTDVERSGVQTWKICAFELPNCASNKLQDVARRMNFQSFCPHKTN